MKWMLGMMMLAAAGTAAAGPTGPAWAWDAGRIGLNGRVQLQAGANGTAVDVASNPAGAAVHVNQNALTQPPTVIVQATASTQPFNYKDNCFLLSDTWGYYIGAGAIDSSGQFNGVIAKMDGETTHGGWGLGGAGAQAVMAMLMGSNSGGNGYTVFPCLGDPDGRMQCTKYATLNDVIPIIQRLFHRPCYDGYIWNN